MEMKLLRLEAKVTHRESHRQRGHQPPNIGGGVGVAITDRLPPIADTPSSPNGDRIDEEVDSFEELELTPRATRQGLVVLGGAHPSHHGGGGGGNRERGPANIAVVTRSGASVASAVAETSFPDGDFSAHMHDEDDENDDERSARSEDGDIEDEGDEDNDGSASSKYLSGFVAFGMCLICLCYSMTRGANKSCHQCFMEQQDRTKAVTN